MTDLAILVMAALLGAPWVVDRTEWWRDLGRRQENAARSTLNRIATAESEFREQDGDRDGVQDYGTLAELARAGLIDGQLGAGESNGYRFELLVSPTQPTFNWIAVANPIEPRQFGERLRSFVMPCNVGRFYALDRTLETNEACVLPPGVLSER